MIRIGIDTNGIYTTQAGVARYIRGLIRGLKHVVTGNISILEVAWDVENFGYRQPERALKTLYRELIWMKLVAPIKLRRHKVDLLHSTAGHWICPPKGVKNVVTLHDLASFRYPERFRLWQRKSGQQAVARAVNADRVICISRFTADEAIRLLGLSPMRIDVVHNGCEFHPSEPAPVERGPSSPLPSDFFLFVGSLEPGKNLALLRGSYRLAHETGKPLPPLLIVGARWEGVRSEGKPPSDWHYLGRQPDEVLVCLYRRALGLVFPSKYEGFGFPVAEAMSLGCPVICSQVASLHEVGGDAALYSEMTSAAYLEAMIRLVRDGELRHELVEKGHAQSAKFSWSKCARETMEIYRQVA